MKKITLMLAFLAFIGMQAVFAQTTVTGTVTDKSGSPIPGATVIPEGQPQFGSLTEADGTYRLDVPAGVESLIFSFIGMETQRVAINGQSSVDVVMLSTDVITDEVVITALGIKRDKKALGYSVQDINSDELGRANNADLINSISGRAAGVQVNSSGGTAGASAYITIRGAASITGNNQPLFIVDGIPIITGGGGGAVDGVATSGRSIDINPEDIATMNVLKGGAATALYGIQAANGAIVITTHKGKSKKFDVLFSSSASFEQISKTPGMQQMYSQGTGGVWVGGNASSWGAKISDLEYDASTTDPTKATYYKWDPYGKIVPKGTAITSGGPVNVYDQFDFFQTGLTLNNNLSVSGGSETTTYYFSVGNMTQEGIVPNNTFERSSFKLNSETKLTSKITTGSSMTYVNSNGNFIQQGSNTSGVMLGLLRTPPTFDNQGRGYDTDVFGEKIGWQFSDLSQRNYRNGGGYDNPYWTANENSWQDVTNRFMGNVYVNYEATDWLNFSYKVGTDWYNRRYKNVLAIGSRTTPTGLVGEYQYTGQIINSDFLINMTKSFSDDLSARLTLGQNMYQSYGKNLYGSANGLSIVEFYQLSNTTDQKTSTGTSTYRTAALFFDAQIDYKNMLYLGVTGRNDWSTTMPADNLSEFYPSTNLAFIFTELGMLKDNAILSFGKLRASYAKTANIAPAYSLSSSFASAAPGDGWTGGLTFPMVATTGTFNGYSWGDVQGNPDLKHETMKTLETGVELKFLKNRLGLDLAVFQNTNTDLLMAVPVAASSGYTEAYMNAGEMTSEGFEVMAYGSPIKTDDFSWDIHVNFTKIKNTVTKLAPGIDNVFLGGFTDPQIRAVAGMEYRSIFGYDWYRDAEGNVLINDDPNDSYPDGFPMTDDREMVALGSVNPDWTANMTNTFSYKGITFSFLIDVKHGGKMYNGTRLAMNNFGTSIETENREVYYMADGSIDFTKTPSGNIVVYSGVLGHVDANGKPVSSGVSNNIPVVNGQAWFTGQGSNFGGGATSPGVEDAGWVRLREVSLSYRLKPQVIGLNFIKGLEVYATGRNLWLKTNYTGIDPETSLLGADNAQGMDYFNMPGTKSYTFGLKLNF